MFDPSFRKLKEDFLSFLRRPVLAISAILLFVLIPAVQLLSLLVFMVIATWVLSSWQQWYYGGSFSARVFIEYLPFFALLLGWLLDSLKNPRMRKLVISVVFVLVVLCQFQTYQYRKAVIHWSEMDKQKYWNVFADPSFLFDKKDEAEYGFYICTIEPFDYRRNIYP